MLRRIYLTNYNRSIRYNNKDLVLTGHFKNELYTYYKKNLDLIVDIFHTGTHNKESKDKSVVCMKTKGGKWELVYIETENEIVLVHIKLRR